VKRYSMQLGPGIIAMQPDLEGKWVKWEDVVHLVTKLRQIEEKNKKLAHPRSGKEALRDG